MAEGDPVDSAIAAIKALNDSFRAERYAYLLGVVAGVGMLLFASYKAVLADQITSS
jgi:hypothetical protein